MVSLWGLSLSPSPSWMHSSQHPWESQHFLSFCPAQHIVMLSSHVASTVHSSTRGGSPDCSTVRAQSHWTTSSNPAAHWAPRGFVCLVFILFYFFRQVSLLCSSGYPGTHCVDQADLRIMDPPASAAWVLGLKVCACTGAPGPLPRRRWSEPLVSFHLFPPTRPCF